MGRGLSLRHFVRVIARAASHCRNACYPPLSDEFITRPSVLREPTPGLRPRRSGLHRASPRAYRGHHRKRLVRAVRSSVARVEHGCPEREWLVVHLPWLLVSLCGRRLSAAMGSTLTPNRCHCLRQHAKIEQTLAAVQGARRTSPRTSAPGPPQKAQDVATESLVNVAYERLPGAARSGALERYAGSNRNLTLSDYAQYSSPIMSLASPM